MPDSFFDLRQTVGWLLLLSYFSGAVLCGFNRRLSGWLLLCALGFCFLTAVEALPVVVLPCVEVGLGRTVDPSKRWIADLIFDLFRLVGVVLLLAGLLLTLSGLRRKLEAPPPFLFGLRPQPEPADEACHIRHIRPEESPDVRP
jgi:hypothetical protein